MMDKPRSFYAFEMLYWCGLRSGELLALTASDFDPGGKNREDQQDISPFKGKRYYHIAQNGEKQQNH